MNAVTELRHKAAALMSEHGWCRHELVDKDRRMCMRGALLVAAGAPHIPGLNLNRSRGEVAHGVFELFESDLVRQAEAEIEREIGPYKTPYYIHRGVIPLWNNATCPSQEAAVAMLRGKPAPVLLLAEVCA